MITKKKVTIFIFLVFIIIIFIVGYGYNRIFGHIVSHNFTIKDFSKSVTDTLKPKKRVSYSAHIVEITGETDDTIKIRICDFCYEQKLIGKVDTIVKNLNYYGTENAIFYLDSYKAKAGSLKIKHAIR